MNLLCRVILYVQAKAKAPNWTKIIWLIMKN